MKLQKKYRSVAVLVLALWMSLLPFSGVFAQELRMGDTNMDGKINSSDARIVLRIAAKLEVPSDEVAMVSDVNGDDKVTSADARLVLCVVAKIYSESIFKDKFSKDETIVVTAKPTISQRETLDWDAILGTSAPTTTRAPVSTTKNPSHPNNWYTTTQKDTTEVPGTVVPTSGNSSGTEPSSGSPSGSQPVSSSGSTVIHTGVPSRPSTEKTTYDPNETEMPTSAPVVTTAPPVTQDPTAPAFVIRPEKGAQGTVRVGIYVKNVASLKEGSFSLLYNSDALEYVSFAANDAVGSVDMRKMNTEQLASEFVLDNAAGSGEVYMGTVVFHVISGDFSGVTLELSVLNHSRYNWRSSSGRPMEKIPESYSYYLLLNETA